MAETQQLVRRLLETPDIARAVPRLHPEVLHRVIEQCGLEDCAEIVALATPRQIERVLDLDLWRAPAPGADDAFDAGRFTEWLEMLFHAGADVLGDMLAGIDLDVIVGGLMEHVRVFDGGAVEPYTTLEGEVVEFYARTGNFVREIGGYVVEARRPQSWEAIVEVLAHLQVERPAFFDRAMRACVGVSHGTQEADGFHDLLGARDQHRLDLATGREARRDALGYVAPAQARGFLQAARAFRLDGEQPPPDPVASACLRDVSLEALSEDAGASADVGLAPEVVSADAQAVGVVMEMLSDAGVVARPRALIGAGEAEDTRLALVNAAAAAHPGAAGALAFLANALVSGCAIQDRPLTPREASDLVLATCNLGLENWPAGWRNQDLITAFQAGWAILHRDLCRHAADAVIDVLRDLECSDRDVQRSLQAVRRAMIRARKDGEPWRARPELDAILMLDAPAWAVLRALIDECPAMHATLTPQGRAPLRVDPAEFVFVARNSEIAAVRAYLDRLAVALTG